MESESLGDMFPVILTTMVKVGEFLGALIQLSHRIAYWIVNPVGSDIIDPKTGLHIGNRRPRMIYSILIPCLLRFAFFPLIIYSVNPLYITSDVGRIIIVLLFAVSSQWIYSGCFMLAPELCKNQEHKEAASLLVVVSLQISLGVGSSAGLGVYNAVVGGK